VIVITDKGRIVYQNRREGKQGFGGGKYKQSLINKLHSARRECFWEANLDMHSNAAVLAIGPPHLVTKWQWCRGKKWWGTCLIQIVLLQDDLVQVLENGIVQVAGTVLFSRECCQGRRDLEDDIYRDNRLGGPSQDAITRGSFFFGKAIFGVAELSPDIMEEFRRVDRQSMQMLWPEVQAAVKGDMLPTRATYQWEDSDVLLTTRADYEYQVAKVLEYWLSLFGEIARVRWPLLTTRILYKTLTVPEWRRAAVAKVRNGSRPRSSRD
jgi:hypothetical protein